MAQMAHLLQRVDDLVDTQWHDHADAGIEDLIVAVEQVQRRLSHVQSELIAVAEATNLWAVSGFRSVNTWLQALTGSTRSGANREVRLSRALRSDLPGTADALAQGRISADHAAIMQRETTKTMLLREQLLQPERGEGFLLGIAEKLSADDFRKAVRHWTIMADPDAADRNFREEGMQEEVFLSAVGDVYHLSGRLGKVSGQALETALTAGMGRKAEGDDRSPANRRAAVLVGWAHARLDSGVLKPGARIRPHLSVHVPFETLQALCDATASAVPPENSFTPGASVFQVLRAPGGPISTAGEILATTGESQPGDCSEQAHFDAQEWVDGWQPGDDHVIAAAVDHKLMRGVPPATFDDGTAIPPSVLSRLACGSSLTRVVFGPESTIIDVGREQRIFPANQTRAIIARDRHCQYPACTEPPEYGEIHHSLWWWKHNGKTSTDQGILLCWHHHAHVHMNNISIARIGGRWVFSSEFGEVIEGVSVQRLVETQPGRDP